MAVREFNGRSEMDIGRVIEMSLREAMSSTRLAAAGQATKIGR